jgi:AcrR family transcriptional regulator
VKKRANGNGSGKGKDTAPALGREHILATALALIDRDGVAALSLRGLATELGVYPTAIYWYVPNRNALIAGAVALALRGVGQRLPGGSWQLRLRAVLKRFRAALHRHPRLAPVIGTELISNSPLDLPMLEHIVGALEDAGFVEVALADAFNVVVAAMCGFVTLELAAAPAEHADAWAQAHQQALRAIPAPTYPALARHLPRLRGKAFILRWTSGTSRPLNSAFEAWLDVIVGGLERRAAMLARAAAKAR